VPLLSILKASKRLKKGAQGLRRRQKAHGRKRHILVDTLGLLLAVVVHAADLQDRDGAKLVFQKLLSFNLLHRFLRLERIWADGGYRGELVAWVLCFGNWILDIVKKDPNQHTFVVLPRRWVVERTFAWLGRYRRMSKDYEQRPESSEAMIYLAMIRLMVRRLAVP